MNKSQSPVPSPLPRPLSSRKFLPCTPETTLHLPLPPWHLPRLQEVDSGTTDSAATFRAQPEMLERPEGDHRGVLPPLSVLGMVSSQLRTDGPPRRISEVTSLFSA